MPQRLELPFLSKGCACAGYLYLPDSGQRNLPCVVMAHGFGGTQDGSLAETARDFALAGIAAYTFDYRGFGESAGSPRQSISLRGQQQDWIAAIEHVRSLGQINSGRLAIWGSSLGGAHVVHVAARERSIKAVIAQVPFNGFPSRVEGRTLAQTWMLLCDAVRDKWRARRGKRPVYIPAVGSPGDHAVMTMKEANRIVAGLAATSWQNEIAPGVLIDLIAGYRAARPARKLAMPLLVCLARDDAHTPPALGRKVAERARQGELRRYPCGHFDLYEEPMRSIVAADQAAFLALHIGGSL